jgi:hypothetical protein
VPLPSQEGVPSLHMVGETPVIRSFAGAAVLLDGDWVPVPHAADAAGTPVAGDGALWSLQLDTTTSPPTMAFSAFRPPDSIDDLVGSVLRIGFSDLRVPEGFTLEDIDAHDEVVQLDVLTRAAVGRGVASFAGPGGACEVASRFGEPADGESVKIDLAGGGSFPAIQVEPGRIDIPEVADFGQVLDVTDVERWLTVGCEDPNDADVLARHVVPTADPAALPEVDGPPPDDEETARQAVIDAYSTVYSADTSDENIVDAVDDPRGVANAFAQARANMPQALDTLAVRVHEVQFLNPTEAAVRYDILVPGLANTVLPDLIGRAVLLDDEWKVTRDTICRDLKQASASCED